jgi:hypothetical protein
MGCLLCNVPQSFPFVIANLIIMGHYATVLQAESKCLSDPQYLWIGLTATRYIVDMMQENFKQPIWPSGSFREVL